MNSFLNQLSLSSYWITFIELILKATLVLLIAFSATKFFKQLSSTAKHFIWSIAFISILVLPILNLSLPNWEVSIFPSENVSIPSSFDTESSIDFIKEKPKISEQKEPLLSNPEISPNSSIEEDTQVFENKNSENMRAKSVNIFSSMKNLISSYNWKVWLFLLWISGSLILFGRFLIQLTGLYISIKKSDNIENKTLTTLFEKSLNKYQYSKNVRLLQNDWIAVPLSWGLLHPTIILPTKAENWPIERMEAVLLHELAHLKRWDFLLTIIAHLTSIVYWFNPLVWFSLRNFHLEREKACDDFVLSLGKKPTDYANNLLEIARSLSYSKWSSSLELSMVRKKYLEGRVKAVLNKNLERKSLKSGTILFTSLISTFLIIPIAGIQTWAQKNNSNEKTKVVSFQKSQNEDTQNRIAVIEGEQIKLFEYNSSEEKYDQVWESIERREKRNRRGWHFSEPIIIDFDKDGKNELIAMDEYGLFIWGKHGKYPLYYNFEKAYLPDSFYNLIIADIDNDSMYEIITQGPYNLDGRTVTVWKIVNNSLKKINSIDLPDFTSWSIRWGDCDGDGIGEFVTSSYVIHILGYEKSKGLYEKDVLSNASKLVDVVRLSDIDNDGKNELLASGNSGCFTIYKARNLRGKTFYTVVYQSTPPQNRGRFSAGLNVGDISGDGKKDILVGLTGRNNRHDNVLVYENQSEWDKNSHYLIEYNFEKTFGMSAASSKIPGYVIGDSDNDGINECVYNNGYVLKFDSKENESLKCIKVDTIASDWAYGSVIGGFKPEGLDVPKQKFRIIPIELVFDLKKDQLIETGGTYKCWAKIKSVWGDVNNLKVRLESNNEKIKLKKSEIKINNLSSGKILEHKNDPFIFFVNEVDSVESVLFDIILEGENGYKIRQPYWNATSIENTPIILRIDPKLKIDSKTLSIGHEKNLPKDMNLEVDYFNTNSFAWPDIDHIKKYKNLFLFDEYQAELYMNYKKLKIFMDNGGNCFIHGGFLTSKPDPDRFSKQNDFITDYLHIKYVDQKEKPVEIRGTDGDILTNGLDFQFKKTGFTTNILEPLEGAVPIFYYPSGEVAGVRFEGKYKLVFLAFGFVDIESLETRKILMNRILEWFDE